MPLSKKPARTIIESLETRRLMHASVPRMFALPSIDVASTTYYISTSGNDANLGTSITTAWKTIAAANAHAFTAGDSILLEGGKTFTGNLILSGDDVGNGTSPITVSSFGTGRATISAGLGDGITIRDTSGINISNINVKGSGATVNVASGINVISDVTDGRRFDSINIDQVDVGGFGFVDIGIGTVQINSGFSNVRITNSSVHDAIDCGIFSYAGNFRANPAQYSLSHSNIYIGHVTAYHIIGHSGQNDSGNGILLGNVDQGVIERCIAYGNGANNTSTSGGNCGIWCYNSNNVIIQYNESYANVSAHIDANGFDIDGGCTNCIMQYNYSHDNYGSGYLLAQFPNANPNTNNIVRYNISQNDARQNNNSAFEIYSASATNTINNTEIYGNTIYLTKPPGTSPEAMLIYQATNNLHIRNNIFAVSPGLKTIVVKAAGMGLLFEGNDYWTGSSNSVGINYIGANYNTLAAFQSATGQEKINSTGVGAAVDPLFQKPGGGGIVGNSDLLTGMTAYLLKPGSSALARGVNLWLLGLNPGATDFYGDVLPGAAAAFDIGANQTNPTPIVLSPLSSDNTFYISSSTDGTTLRIWQNTTAPGTGVPTRTVPISSVASLQIDAGGGTNTITFDISAGNPLAGKIGTFNGSGNTSVNFIGSNAADGFLISSTAILVGTATINYNNIASTQINSGGGNDILTQFTQPRTALAFNSGGGNDTLTINSGAYTFFPGGSSTGLTVNDSGIVQFATGAVDTGITAYPLAGLNIASGAKAFLAASAAAADRSVLILSALNIAAAGSNYTGQLDLTNGDMVVHKGNLTNISSQLRSGSNFANAGYWNGQGIISSTIAGGSLISALGFAPATASSFDRQNVTTTDVLVANTVYGDSDLNLALNSADYTHINTGFAKNLTGWSNGDYNYDNQIDGSDFALIDNVFNRVAT